MNTSNVARAFCLVLLGFAQYGTCQTQSIAAIASGRDDLSTLVAALTQAELVETFSTDGNYTVFAPTNDAFEAFLNTNTLTAGDLFGNPTLLESYLTYHVLPSVVASGDISNGAVVETLGGMSVGFDTTDGVKIAHGATPKVMVTEADIMASNGIIHVVDNVLVPPTMTITEMVADTASLSTLLAAVQAAGLVDALAGEGPLTVFAPTNDGANITLTALGLTPAELLASENLAKYLQYHVTTGVVLSSTLTANTDIATLGDMTLPFVADGDSDDLSILTPGNIETADIMATNGVVHLVNKMMNPLEPPANTTPEPTASPTPAPTPANPTPAPTPANPTPAPTPASPTPAPTPASPTPAPTPASPTPAPTQDDATPEPTPADDSSAVTVGMTTWAVVPVALLLAAAPLGI